MVLNDIRNEVNIATKADFLAACRIRLEAHTWPARTGANNLVDKSILLRKADISVKLKIISGFILT